MCRSVTLPTCGAHRPVPTNGSRSYIRFLTRNSGCTHLHSTTEMSTSSRSSSSSISGRPAINRSITAMCQAKGRNTICGRGPSSCLPHLTSLDTIHRHQLGNSQFLSGVHPAIICIVQKRPEGRGNGISLPKQDTQAGTLQPSRMNGGGTASIFLSRRLYNTGLYL